MHDRGRRSGTAPGRRRRATRPGRSGWPGASTMIGWPPSSAMPASNDTRVRRLGLSKSTATDRGPASGRCAYRSAFIAAARSSTAACSAGLRSSSRRKCRIMRATLVQASVRGSAARNASACSAVRISGGASRITSGLHRVDQEARRPAARPATAAGHRRGRARCRAAGRRRAPRPPAGGRAPRCRAAAARRPA